MTDNIPDISKLTLNDTVTKLYVKQTASAGRATYATQSIKAGDIVSTEPLYLYGLGRLAPSEINDDNQKLCRNCLLPLKSKADGRCGTCKQVHYCSSQCQKLHWKSIHWLECYILAQMPPNKHSTFQMIAMFMGGAAFEYYPPRHLMMFHLQLYRILLLCKFETSVTNQQQLDTFNSLHGYMATGPGADDSQSEIDIVQQLLSSLKPLVTGNVDRSKLSKSLVNKLPTLLIHRNDILHIITDTEQMRADYTKVQANNFSVHKSGQSVALVASLINHSCVPNCVQHNTGTIKEIIAVTDITKDEEITVSYIVDGQAYDKRQNELQQNYGFVCQCSKCRAKK